jgi:hypothetical protein
MAEATGVSQVRFAKAVEEQCGPQPQCAVTSTLADTAEQDGIRKAHVILKKTGLELDTTITQLPESCASTYVILLSDLIASMVKHGTLGRLYGGLPLDELGDVLEQFWKDYESIDPDLCIFDDFRSGMTDPRKTIPMFIHGDEGRGLHPSLNCTCMTSRVHSSFSVLLVPAFAHELLYNSLGST